MELEKVLEQCGGNLYNDLIAALYKERSGWQRVNRVPIQRDTAKF